MRRNNEPFIKNKKLFITANILLICIMILDAVGVSPNNEYLDGLSEVAVLMGIITMFFLSVKHNAIINIFYGFCIFVCIMLIIIAGLLFLGVL